jgi:hypothetical protein
MVVVFMNLPLLWSQQAAPGARPGVHTRSRTFLFRLFNKSRWLDAPRVRP